MNSTTNIRSYHAHIYFEGAEQRETAIVLREVIAERFSVQLGRVHDRLVGPHARPMYQVAFSTEVFAIFVPWLMLNRQGLAVLVYPNTDQPRRDHLIYALWLGEVLPILNIESLPESAEGEADDQVVPNTTPTIAPRDPHRPLPGAAASGGAAPVPVDLHQRPRYLSKRAAAARQFRGWGKSLLDM